ncbi:hypothetical protein BDV93DRAFT_591655 [Ceratobasidium sp. AG-I]|nr:hypothetical protein BDV93DRAFT_591655 [Ceratobasidium sp. AG-I]
MSASLQVARTKISSVQANGDSITKGAWYARTLRSKAEHIRSYGELPDRRQGKGAAHATLLDDPLVKKSLKTFISSLKITPLSVMKEVNTNILPRLSTTKQSITENTAKKWLLKLGYRRETYRKGIYMDGHERADVVKYRNEFLDNRFQIYSDKECEPLPLKLPTGTSQIIPVFHDECCFHANDQSTSSWIMEGETLLRQKGRGRLVHVSDFIVETSGRLSLTEEQIAQQKALPESERLGAWDARKIIYPGKNQDAYWDMPQLIEQVKNAIRIFNIMHPGAVMLMFFDQSSAHNAYASDALSARKMNVTPGSKQPAMQATTIPIDNPHPALQGQHQSMVFPSTHQEHPNKPKGMEQVLRERGLWDTLTRTAGGKRPVGRCKGCKATAAVREKVLAEAQATMELNPEVFASIGRHIFQSSIHMTMNRFCCMEKCLSTEADFIGEKPLLQIVIEEAGHLCILLPKFHCELNPIEMYWGYAKQRFRPKCNGSFPLAKKLVPECLDACSVTTIRRFFQKTWRYMDAYREGLTGLMAEHAVKKFASHRKITKRIMMEVTVLAT